MMFVVVTAAAFVVVLMVFMMMTAAAFVVVLMMLVVVTAAAFVVVLMMFVVMTAAAFVVVLMMFVVVTAAACMVVPMMLMMVLMFPNRALSVSGINLHFPFYRPGDPDQLRNQGIRIFCRQPQLLCGKGDDRFLHTLVIVEFLLDLCCAVGTVQIVDNIHFSRHWYPSYLF